MFRSSGLKQYVTATSAKNRNLACYALGSFSHFRSSGLKRSVDVAEHVDAVGDESTFRLPDQATPPWMMLPPSSQSLPV